jgi:hypothetical protein
MRLKKEWLYRNNNHDVLMPTVSGDCIPFEEAEAVLILKCRYFARCKLRDEFGRSIRGIVYISGGFV